MIIQYVVIFITLVAVFFFSNTRCDSESEQQQMRKWFVWILSGLCVLQSGLRHIGVGADTYSYLLLFEEAHESSWQQIFHNFHEVYVEGSGKDAGYTLLVKIFQVFSNDYRMYLLFVAIFFFTAFAVFIYRNTENFRDIVFAFILYEALFYAFFSITGIRQTLATGFALWGFECIKSRRWIVFTCLILFAAFIHKSILLFLPYYFIGNIRRSRTIFIIAILGFPALMVFRRAFAIWLASLSFSDLYMMYAESTYKSGTYTFTALILLIAFFGWIFMKPVLESNPGSFRYFNAMAIAIVLTPLTWVDPSLMRVVQYFSVFMLVLIPAIVNAVITYPVALRTWTYAIMIAALIYLIAKVGLDYKFMWQPMKVEGISY